MTNDLQDKILDATNGGLDIILNYYPNAREGKNFKIRDERTASTSLKRVDGGVYVVTDFGADSKPMNAIAVFAKEEGMAYKEAMTQLGRQFNLLDQKTTLRPEIRKMKPTEVDYLDQFTESGHYFQFKTEFTQDELDILGPLVTQEVCAKYKLFSVQFYAKKKDNEIVQISSTESFPIFAFVNQDKDGKEWIKVLQPKSEDKAFRFFYVGGRPSDFVFGMEIIKKEFAKKQAELLENFDEEEDTKKKDDGKIPRIILAAGDRDGLNAAGAGEFVIWMNSETATFTPGLYKNLMSMAQKIVNIPDIDQTGRTQGVNLAMEYLDIYTAWLPESLTRSRDFRGASKKDFLDFINQFRHNNWQLKREVQLLLDNAKRCQFWDVKYSKTSISYEFHNVNAYYFLSLSGFYRMENPENEEDYIFIKKTDHLITKVNYLQVKDYVNSFLEEKQRSLGETIIPNGLRNMVYNSNKMSESSLVNLPSISPDFTDFDRNSQLLFFRNEIWRITAKGIVSEDVSKATKNVWEKDIIENKVEKTYSIKFDSRYISIDSDYFHIYRDNEGDFNIKLLTDQCEFINYLINTSRVFWEKENYALAPLSDEEKEKYWNENRFNIESKFLTEDEIHEQKLHLINKIYVFGYLMHRYKNPNKSWLVWLMDNEIVDDSESHGRTGKSLFSNSMRVFMDTEVLGARDKKLFDNQFLYARVTKYTDYLLFDDADKYFNVGNIYTRITGDFGVNPKNNKEFVIPFSESPKMAVSTNYAIGDASSSTHDRLLIGVFSNYYHAESKDMERRTPMDDFGHMFFNDWDSAEYNRFFNFAAQALKFYLKTNEKLSAPQGNVIKRNSLTQMGAAFQNWADYYLSQYLNTSLNSENLINKREAYEDLKSSEKSLSSITINNFTKKMEHWCTYNEVILDPAEKCNTKDGRITRWVPLENKTVQFHYLLKETQEGSENEDQNIELKDDLDGLDF